MIQPIPKPELPAELLAVLLSLSSSVQTRPNGNSVIRFWWPAKGTKDAAGNEIGKFRGVSTGTPAKKISKDLKKQIIADWFIVNGFVPKPAPKAGAADLEWEIEEYIAAVYGTSPVGTVKPIRQALRRLRQTLAAGEPSRKIAPVYSAIGITTEAFDAAVEKLKIREKAPREGQTKFLKPKAWKNLFGNIHPFIRWEMKRGNLISDPTLNTVTPTKAELNEARPVRTVWPDKEFEATLAKISFRDMKLQNGAGSSAAWVKLSKFTLKLLRWGGMDVNDVYRLKANHIWEDSEGKLWIKKKRGKARTKSGAEKINLPVSSKVEKELREYWIAAEAEGPETPVLPWHTRFNTHRSFSSWIFKMVQKARKRAGLPPRDIKSFRHTFVTDHIKRGKVKLSQLREWLGHAKDSRMIEDTYDLSEYGADAMD